MNKPQRNHRILVCWFLALFVGITAGCSTLSEEKTSRATVPRLTSEEQHKLDYFFLEAERLKAKGDYAAAFELFRHCEAIGPSAQINASLSPFYFVLGNDSLGITYQQAAAELDPNNYWYFWQLGAIYQSGQKFKEAIRIYEEMLRRFPEKDDPLYALIELYPQNGDYDKAVKLLNDLEKKVGKSEELSMQKFQLYLYQEKGKEAFQEIESLVKEYPDDLRYRCVLGDLYLSHQKYPEALKTYQDILAEDPSNEPVLLSMVDYYEALRDTAAYRNQIDSVLFSHYVGDESKGRLMRQIILKSGETPLIDSTQIIALFDRMASEGLEGEDLLMLNAQYLISLNRPEKAHPVLEKILRRDPSNELVRKQLLAEAIRTENSQLVVELCLPLTEKTPESPDDLIFFYYLAAGYYQLDDYESALRTLHKALGYVTEEVKPAVISDFYAMMGDLYHLQKKNEEAYAAYDSSLLHNPLNIGALNNYAYYLSEEPDGDLVKAEKLSLKTIEVQPDNDTYLDTYAWILYRLGRYEDAKVYIDRALQNGGANNAVELDHAGDIYMKLDRKEEAVNFWKQALKKEIEEPQKVEQKIEQAK